MKLSKFLSPSYKLSTAITILLLFFLVETICYAYFYISLAYSQQIMTLLILVQVLLPFVLLVIYIPYLNKASKKTVLILISIFYFLELLAAIYRVSREVSFNWFWLWYNKSEVFETIIGVFDNFGLYLAGLILIFILIYLSLSHVINRITELHGKKKYRALVILPLLIS